MLLHMISGDALDNKETLSALPGKLCQCTGEDHQTGKINPLVSILDVLCVSIVMSVLATLVASPWISG